MRYEITLQSHDMNAIAINGAYFRAAGLVINVHSPARGILLGS